MIVPCFAGVRRLLDGVALIALAVFMVACSGGDGGSPSPGDTDGTSVPGLACDTDFDCPFGRCVAGQCVRDEQSTAHGNDVSDTGPTTVEPDVDVTGPGDTGDTDGDVGGSTDGPNPERGMLFRPCETDADCPVVGTRCIESIGYNRSWESTTSADRVNVANLFDAGSAGAQSRICSRECSEDGQTTCDGIADSSPWTCQVVAEVDLYGEAMAAGEIPDGPLLLEFERGAPFAALCRPPSTRLSEGHDVLCDTCSSDADCGAIGRCARAQLADGSQSAGYCAPFCPSDGCPLGFTCEDGHCLAIAGTCGDCRDLDGNGYGVGHCEFHEIDCDDTNPDAYFASGRTPIVDQCGSFDLNCNGIPDADELVGPDGLASSRHCTTCDDECSAEALGESSDLPNAGAVCIWEDDDATVAACVPGCQPGFENCDGVDSTGCETDLSGDTSCGGCGIDCATEALPNVETLTCEDVGGSLDGSGPFACRPADCSTGHDSCDGDWETGCETDIRSTVEHCGECDSPCPERANAEVVCVDSGCALGTCDTNFDNCDGDDLTGCETHLRSSVEHCSACGTTCLRANVASAECLNGNCTNIQCNSGFDSCDGQLTTGCEANLNTNVAHCGTCGNDCSALPNVASATCNGGACIIQACVEGFRNCDGNAATGCERDVRTLTDCGNCGTSCSPPEPSLSASCATGECVCVDASPIEICNGVHSRCEHDADEGCPAGFRSPNVTPTRRPMQATSEPDRCNQGYQDCNGPLSRQNHRVVSLGIVPTSGVHCPATGQCPFPPSVCLSPTEPIVGIETFHYANGRVMAVTPIYASFDVGSGTGTHSGTGNFERYPLTSQTRDGFRYGEPGGETRSTRTVCSSGQLLTGLDAILNGTNVHGFRLRCHRIEIRLGTIGLSNPNPLLRYTVATTGSATTQETPPLHHQTANPAFRTIVPASGVRHTVGLELVFRQRDDQCTEVTTSSAQLTFVAAYTRDTIEILP